MKKFIKFILLLILIAIVVVVIEYFTNPVVTNWVNGVFESIKNFVTSIGNKKNAELIYYLG